MSGHLDVRRAAATILAVLLLIAGGCREEQDNGARQPALDRDPLSARVALNEQTDSAWREVRAFDTGMARVRGIAVDRAEQVYVAGDREVRVFDSSGRTVRRLELSAEPFAVAVTKEGRVWVAFDRHVEAYDKSGRTLAAGTKHGPRSALAGLAVTDDTVYAADAGLRLIHRYDRNLVHRDSLPGEAAARADAELVVPSRYLDVAPGPGDLVFVLNPGRHRVDAYVRDRVAFSWGGPGRGEAEFVGCCNPIALTVLPDGDVITGEKGRVQVKRFSPEGELLDIIAGPEEYTEQTAACARRGLARLESGVDLAADRRGRVYVLEPCAAAVRVYAQRDEGGGHG